MTRPTVVPHSGNSVDGRGRVPYMVTSLDAAEQLQRELEHLGIASDVHDGYGLALVSVCVGLVVWCDCERFWWRTGWDVIRKRALYAWHPALEPARAASRLAHCYADVHAPRPVPTLIAGPRA